LDVIVEGYMSRKLIVGVLLLALFAPLYAFGFDPFADRPVLWLDPGNIAARDLTYGPGAAELAPAAPFHFLEEDKAGDSPKFRVRDAKGVTWVVKLGPEAQSETVATRIVWAVGYFAEEAYFLHRAEVHNLPRLSRGMQHVEDGRFVRHARFEPRRENVKRGDRWKWLKNPFVGTRELEGLKVLMVLLNNYDTRPANNAVFAETDPVTGRTAEYYLVTDLGATLGAVGGLGGRRSKNNLRDFQRSRFIRRVKDGVVEFDYNTTPSGLGYLTFVFSPWYWRSQAEKEKAMKGVSVEHARWMGSLLARITDRQFHEAFEASGYTPTTATGFINVLQDRIRLLNRVSSARKYS
jgi:hypothetical protein